MQASRELERQRLKGYVLAVVAAVCWATGGLSAKWLFSPSDVSTASWPVPPPGIVVDAVVLAGARALTAALILLVLVAVMHPRSLRIRPTDLGFLSVFGILGLAGVHVTYFQAITHTNVATAILLEYLAPIIVLGVSVLVLGERMTWALPVGVTLSVTGCALVVGAIGGDGLAISTPGLVWGLTSAVFFALYSLLGKYAAARFSPWTLLTYGLLFASAFWVVYLRGLTPVIELLSHPSGLIVVLYMAVFATIVPFAAFLKALHYIDATKAVVTSTLEPVVAGIAAFLLFSEGFAALQLLGGGLVIAAIFVVQRQPGIEPVLEVPPAP
ncbi:MAG: DMT family transporter [Coriobacteriia bacterium]|nr:DMT family transporter [Coriobacteriia bacterium]